MGGSPVPQNPGGRVTAWASAEGGIPWRNRSTNVVRSRQRISCIERAARGNIAVLREVKVLNPRDTGRGIYCKSKCLAILTMIALEERKGDSVGSRF